MTVELVLLIVCIAGAGLSNGSETALVSVSRLRLRHLRSEGRLAAGIALGLVERRERILAVTLVMTNVFMITGGAVATAALEKTMGSIGSVAATITMTIFFLVLSEIVPKAYFRHHPERMLMRTAPFWRALSIVLAPVTKPFEWTTTLLFRIFHKAPRSVFVTREEMKLVLEESAERGSIRQMEQEMLESTLEYAETMARQVMVPITEVAMLPESARTEELLALVRDRGHTRIPIYRDRVDQIVGLVNVFDVLYDETPKKHVRAYMRPARLVPDTKSIDELFLEMQRERESLAVIVNEFGSCFGVVAMEDILEEIFGELSDEHEDATPEVHEIAPNRFRISARADIDDVADETGFKIPKAGYETVGGYVLYRLGRIPRRGDAFTDGDLRVRVLDADRYGVRMVELRSKSGG